MTQKDWILLMVPVLCNGVIIFILQKIFEKRQLAVAAKQKYVSVLQDKVDATLSLFIEVMKSSKDDMEQTNYLNQFLQSFADVYYFYQQNVTVFGAIKSNMCKALEVYNRIQDICQKINYEKNSTITRLQLEDNLLALYEVLQKLQLLCINYKV